jgi:hypothetical protein
MRLSKLSSPVRPPHVIHSSVLEPLREDHGARCRRCEGRTSPRGQASPTRGVTEPEEISLLRQRGALERAGQFPDIAGSVVAE